jgi:drug/metabolite transporter (DMT)-like permease
VFEILAIRNAAGLAVLLAIMAWRPQLRSLLATGHIGLHALRNVVHFASQLAWAMSLTLLPLATVFALEFTTPAWVALLATLLLGEQMTLSRAGAVGLGFLGVLLILRPGSESFRPAVLLILAAALGFAIAMTATKKLTQVASTFAILFFMNAMQLPMNLLGSSPAVLAKIGPHNFLEVCGLAVAGLSGHYCLTNAFRAGDAVVVVPLDFLRIPLIAVVGWTLYGEALDGFVFAGAGLIVAGILLNLRAEMLRPAITR